MREIPLIPLRSPPCEGDEIVATESEGVAPPTQCRHACDDAGSGEYVGAARQELSNIEQIAQVIDVLEGGPPGCLTEVPTDVVGLVPRPWRAARISATRW